MTLVRFLIVFHTLPHNMFHIALSSSDERSQTRKHVRFLPDTTHLTRDNRHMNVNSEEIQQAALSGDLRYDGRFFAAGITTGCYCRPGWGGTPKPENVLFFACAAAAQAAGFRPCRRCRPETP